MDGYQETARVFFEAKSLIQLRSQLSNAKKSKQDGTYVYGSGKHITQEQLINLRQQNANQLAKIIPKLIKIEKGLSKKLDESGNSLIETY